MLNHSNMCAMVNEPLFNPGLTMITTCMNFITCRFRSYLHSRSLKSSKGCVVLIKGAKSRKRIAYLITDRVQMNLQVSGHTQKYDHHNQV